MKTLLVQKMDLAKQVKIPLWTRATIVGKNLDEFYEDWTKQYQEGVDRRFWKMHYPSWF